MGMFDHIRCKYPLPVAGANELQYQTKDLECYLDYFEIAEDGSLWELSYDTTTKEFNRMARVAEYTGEICFYTDYGPKNKNGWGEGWLEFSAYLESGNVVRMNLIQNKLPPET